MKLDDHWKGAVPEIEEWWTGDANSPTVLLQNDQEEIERNPIYNILGKITGVEQPEKSSMYFQCCPVAFLLSDQKLSAETFLGRSNSLDTFQGPAYPLKLAMLTSNFHPSHCWQPP